MKKTLTRTTDETYYYEDSVRIEGVPKGITGNLSGVRGNLSGVTGNLSGVRGDLDDCDITKEEREKGIDINELIK